MTPAKYKKVDQIGCNFRSCRARDKSHFGQVVRVWLQKNLLQCCKASLKEDIVFVGKYVEGLEICEAVQKK